MGLNVSNNAEFPECATEKLFCPIVGLTPRIKLLVQLASPLCSEGSEWGSLGTSPSAPVRCLWKRDPLVFPC